jgi:hypothetical protein
MLHIFCETCEGIISLPIGVDHKCGRDAVLGVGYTTYIGGDDWFGDDSDY